MSKQVAIIGAGYTAKEHIRAFADHPGATIVCIFSRTRARAEAPRLVEPMPRRAEDDDPPGARALRHGESRDAHRPGALHHDAVTPLDATDTHRVAFLFCG